jgi:hypothetical protein
MRLLLVQPTTKYLDRRPLRSRTRWLVGIFQKFYSFRSIFGRLLWSPNRYIFQGLPSNLFFHWAANRHIDPVDFY